MKKDKKYKMKQKRALFNQITCRLCSRPSNSLHVNGFCTCVAASDDYEFTESLSPSGKLVKLQSLKESSKKTLKIKYRALGGENITGLKERIRDSLASKKPKKKDKVANKARANKKEFYETWEWKELRYKILLKYGPTCMLCGATSKDAKICVDHIKPISLNWDMRLNEDNLQVLCDSCNMGKSNLSEEDFRPPKN